MLLLAGFLAGFTPVAQAFYNPDTGRWLSRDPIGESGGLSQYAFVDNQPTVYVDLFGLQKGGARLLELLRKRDNRECRSQCPESEKVTVYVVNRGSPERQRPADAKPDQGRPGSLPRWTGGHIDLVVPGCESGLVGFYGLMQYGAQQHGVGGAAFGGIPGRVNLSVHDCLGGFAQRPEYLTGHRSYICELRVCPSDAKKMCEKAKEMAINPPDFKLVGGNCSTRACSILNAGNAGPAGGIRGMDNPQALQRQINSKNCYYGTTPLVGEYDFLAWRMNYQVNVVKDPNQSPPTNQ
jgi:hypothetical protein